MTIPSPGNWPETATIGGINSIEKKEIVYCASVQESNDDLPVAHVVVGIFTSKIDITDDDAKTLCAQLIPRKSGQAVIIAAPADEVINDLDAKTIDLKSGKISKVDVHVIDDSDFLNEMMIIKVAGSIPINCKVDKEALDQFLSGWLESNEKLKFEMNDDFLLQSGNKEKCVELYRKVVDDESRAITDVDAPAALKNKGLEKLAKQRMVAKKPIVMGIAGFPLVDGGDVSKITSKLSIGETINCRFNVEILTLVPTHALGDLLCRNLSAGVHNQMKGLVNFLVANLSGDSDNWYPQVYNFWPKKYCSYFISTVYPSVSKDEELLETRRALLRKLYLPHDRPLLRKLNRYLLPIERLQSNPYLINVHEGVNSESGSSGQYFLVDGDYEYRHYLQDKVNDNGWGCAYRSLQTIVSWFRLQGYTDVSVPSHKEIQQALVDVGDKEPSFVGSSKWIGSQEVGYVLNQLLNVDYKTLFVSSGAELADKGRELSHHFQTHGTPIMVGGGQLAHTILGVQWNDSTGDIKFLILDPHYTGSEDLSVIQKKGWCGWKAPSFWDSKNFYNLCMPQRPNVF